MRLKRAIEHLHNCCAQWRRTVPVREPFNGKLIWKGDVEVFDLDGHPMAKQCYGWSYGEPKKLITILGMPPVTDAQSAVRVSMAYQIKKARKK